MGGLMEHEIEIDHHTGTNKRIDILIAVMAAVLAFTEMAARNADTDVVRETVQAADTWAFYQAKSIRAAMLRADAQALQLQGANEGSSLGGANHRGLGGDGDARRF